MKLKNLMIKQDWKPSGINKYKKLLSLIWIIDDAARQADERDKGVTFKNCPQFTKCISRINNTDIDNTHDIDIVMPMYNLIEHSDNYSKTSGSLWQYYKDDPNDNLTDSESFKSKVKITGNTPNNGNIKDAILAIFGEHLRCY